MSSRESKGDHIRKIRLMYQGIKMATKPLSEDLDKTESRIYEPVNAILNFLRLRIDEELSISPVRRLIREYLADQDDEQYASEVADEWSMEANTSADVVPAGLPDQFIIVEKNQIPDFTVFQWRSGTNRPPRMVVEVKPLEAPKTLVNAKNVVAQTTWQMLRQAMHAFETDGDFDSIHILCIVEDFFSMTIIKREDRLLLPPCEVDELVLGAFEQQKLTAIRKFYARTRDTLIRGTGKILDQTANDYSFRFKADWDSFAATYHLQCDWS